MQRLHVLRLKSRFTPLAANANPARPKPATEAELAAAAFRDALARTSLPEAEAAPSPPEPPPEPPHEPAAEPAAVPRPRLEAGPATPPDTSPDTTPVADFMLGISYDLWEGRMLDALDQAFGVDTILRSPQGAVNGPRQIRTCMQAELAEIPDQKRLGEDVIWCKTDATADLPTGFYAAARMLVTGHHRGHPVRFRSAFEGWGTRGRLRDAWQIADRSAVLAQLGIDMPAHVAAQIAAEGGTERCARPLSPETDLEGPYLAWGHPGVPGEELRAILSDIMGGGYSVISERYDRACELALPGGVTAHGHLGAEAFWLDLRAAFPGAAFRVEHCVGLDEPGQMPRAALRWTLYGKHDGGGRFGPATGGFVYVMGTTHAEFGPRGLRREWTLIDETAIWRQILIARG